MDWAPVHFSKRLTDRSFKSEEKWKLFPEYLRGVERALYPPVTLFSFPLFFLFFGQHSRFYFLFSSLNRILAQFRSFTPPSFLISNFPLCVSLFITFNTFLSSESNLLMIANNKALLISFRASENVSLNITNVPIWIFNQGLYDLHSEMNKYFLSFFLGKTCKNPFRIQQAEEKVKHFSLGFRGRIVDCKNKKKKDSVSFGGIVFSFQIFLNRKFRKLSLVQALKTT